MNSAYISLSNAAEFANRRTDRTPIDAVTIIIAGADGKLSVFWRNSMQSTTGLFVYSGQVRDVVSVGKLLQVTKQDLARLEVSPEIQATLFEPTIEDQARFALLGMDDGMRVLMETTPATISREMLFVEERDFNKWLNEPASRQQRPDKAEPSWKEEARRTGERWMSAERNAGRTPGVEAIAHYVEGELSNRNIKGPRGRFLDWTTIKREALTGITGRKANGKK